VSERNSKSTELPVKCGLTPKKCRPGSAYVLAAMSLIVLTILGLGMLTVAGQTRYAAIKFKSEAVSMLAAEAGYEKAVYWMGRQPDMLAALQSEAAGTTGSLSFPDGACNYKIELYTFAGARPVYRVVSDGRSGAFGRTVEVLVMQAISGWDMGMCRVASGTTSTTAVNFVTGEIIDIPIHINELKDSPDQRDIYISGDPRFLRPVSMSEDQYTSGGADKYSSVIDLFEDGVYFGQPECRVSEPATIQDKIDRFADSTKSQFKFKPVAGASLTNKEPAVQLEFYVDGDIGKVRISNNCTVRGFKQSDDSRTYDFKVKSGKTDEYERYNIYSYHVRPTSAAPTVESIEETYVTQSFGGVESTPGGQIFVEGNVIIGGDATTHSGDQVVKGKITVVATGSIWVADSVTVDGTHDADGKPSAGNPNVLGLIAQQVVKVVDPGMSQYSSGGTNNYPGPPTSVPSGYTYVPVARYQSGSTYNRYLPDPMVVEAAITAGGGGWGAENVKRGSYGGRKDASGVEDDLVVHGAIVEAIRGVVGLTGSDGFLKKYYMDDRLLEGILPADLWLRGKYIPAPAGWHDYQSGT
jgi:hypothetical protein